MEVKSGGLDPLPAKLFRMYGEARTPTICHIVNASIRTLIFPKQWKYAAVKPLLAKEGLQREEEK